MSNAWIGIDLDGTLAEYHGWEPGIGAPVPRMLARVKQWLAEGREVRIMTARVSHGGGFSEESQRHADSVFVVEQRRLIESWCVQHIGHMLPVTCEKDFLMEVLWDDRAVQVIPNTGVRADGKE